MRVTVTPTRLLVLGGVAILVVLLPEAALLLLPGLCVLPRRRTRSSPTCTTTGSGHTETTGTPQPSHPTSGTGEPQQSGFASAKPRQAHPSTSANTSTSTIHPRGTLLDVVARAHLVSVVFWILLFLQLRWLRLPLLGTTRVVLLCSAAVFAARLLMDSISVRRRRALFGAVALAATLALRLWPAAYHSLPPGDDIAFPCLMARLVYEADTHPRTCEPLLPDTSFGIFASGMASLTAQVALLAKRPVWISIWHLSLVAFVSHWLALYLLLRRGFSTPVAWLAAGLIVLLGRLPSAYLINGQGATVLSHALLVFGGACLVGGSRFGNLLGAAASWVAAWAVHPIPALASLYVGAAVLPVAILLGWRPRGRSVAAVMVVGVVLALPLKEAFSVTRSSYETTYASQWSTRFEGLGVEREAATLLTRLRRFLEGGVGIPLLVLAGFGWLLAFRRGQEEGCLLGWLGIACLALPLVPYTPKLPLSYVLYPYRTLTLFLVPVAWSVGALLSALGHFLGSRLSRMDTRVARGTPWLALAIVVLVGLPGQRKNYEPGSTGVGRGLTPAAVETALWIAENTTLSDRIWADGPGGGWLPAVAFRRVANPRANPMLRDEVKAAREWSSITHLYHCDVHPRRLSRPALYRSPFLDLLYLQGPLSFFSVADGEALLRLIRREEELDSKAGEWKGRAPAAARP